jgi:hypothetical protein
MPKCNNYRKEEAQHTQTREKCVTQPDLVILYATYIYGMMWCDAACPLVISLGLVRYVVWMGWLAHDPSHSFPPFSPALATVTLAANYIHITFSLS